jgi:AMMECR1 domain-containing protein
MLAIKRELKLNKVETSLMRGCAGFKRFVYNKGMIANCKLAEAVSNNCFYEIRRQLTYKQS